MGTNFSRTFVTGADGFIGSHLVSQLVQNGYSVKALAQYNSFGSFGWLDSLEPEIQANVEIVLGDIRDSFFIEKALTGCDSVLHLASLIAIPYSFTAPNSYLETNIIGTLNVLEASKKHHISKIVHTSTSEVFGTAQYVPIDEKHPINPQSPYAATKASADNLAYSYSASFELPITVLRPFNTFGPRQSARAIIPTIISQIINNINPIRLGSTSATRDLTYVTDTATGFIQALENAPGKGENLNLGTGFEISILDLAKTIAEIMNINLQIETDLNRIRPGKSEVERLVSNSAQATSLIGWSPVYKGPEGLRNALELTIDWFSRPDNISRYRADIYNV